MLGKNNVFAVLLTSTLLTTNTPLVNTNYMYIKGTKENNQIILNYDKQQNKQKLYIQQIENKFKEIHKQEVAKQLEIQKEKEKQIEEGY